MSLIEKIEEIEEIEASVTGPMTRDDMMRAFEHVPRLCAAVRELNRTIVCLEPDKGSPGHAEGRRFVKLAIARAEAALEGEEQ